MPDDARIHRALKDHDQSIRSEILKLARKGRLVDRCFREFHQVVYPGAPDAQVHMLRIAFFAGAAELHTVQMYGLEAGGDDPTDDDLAFYGRIVDEITLFHKRTMDAHMRAMKPRGEA